MFGVSAISRKRASASADRQIARQGDELGSHQTAGRVVVIRQQFSDVRLFFALHQAEQLFGFSSGRSPRTSAASSGDIHSENVSRSLFIQIPEDARLVLGRHLFESLSGDFVVECCNDSQCRDDRKALPPDARSRPDEAAPVFPRDDFNCTVAASVAK